MTNDGTQEPGPPPVLSDPLSGLVTGSRYEQEPVKVRVVEPPMPDISAVREAMEGMLDEDSELDLGLVSRVTRQAMASDSAIPAPAPAPSPSPEAAGGGEAAAAPAPAAPAEPPAPAAPAEAAAPNDPTPTPPFGIPAQKVVPQPRRVRKLVTARTAKIVAPGSVETPRRLPRQWPGMRRRRRLTPPSRRAAAMGRKSSAPSIAAIAVLLLVIAVIAIVLIASLIDTIASIFG
jgi:hypothetical protein